MLGTLIIALMAAPTPREAPMSRQMQQGPMPAENIWLRPAHPGGPDYHMFPDIALGGFRIDGDTLYVRVQNKGQTATPGPVLVAARAEVSGGKTDLVEQRTARLQPGETRWVSLRGFSVKTATTNPAVFALESATAVSAVARMMPSSTPALDRTGQSREVGTQEADEANNVLTVAGTAIEHGKPR